MSEELCESEYIEALMADFGLTEKDTLGELLTAVQEDEADDEEED